MEDTSVGYAVLSLMALLGIAAVIYLAARRLRLQFSITLVFVGLGLGELIRRVAVLEPLGRLELSPEIVTFVLLPVLMFEAALSLDSRLLLRHALPILVLAVPSVIVSSLLIGVGLHWAIGLPLGSALLFGTLISATDSTAAVAIFRELGGPTRLGVLMDGENLFNDATSILLFRITAGALGLLGGATLVGTEGLVGAATLSFVSNFAGGLLVGWMFGLAFGKLIELVRDDELIQILLTTVAAYLGFLVGELLLDVSGVMAAVGAGLTLSGWGRTKFSAGALEFLTRYWSYVSFVASSLAFLLVGIAIDLPRLTGSLVPILWAIATSVAARGVSVFGLFPVVNRLPGVEKADLRYQSVMVWGGLRGAVPLVLAMSLPESFVHREMLLDLSIGVVLFSLLVQATTLKPMLRYLGLQEPTPSEAYLRDEGLLSAKRHAREQIEGLRATGLFQEGVTSDLDASYAADEQALRERIDRIRAQGLLGPMEASGLLKRQHLLLEKQAYLDLFHRGQLSERVLKRLQYALETQLDYLRLGRVASPWASRAPPLARVGDLVFRSLDALRPGLRIVQRMRLSYIADRYEEHWGRMVATEEVMNAIGRLDPSGPHAALIAELEALYRDWNALARDRLDAITEQFPEYAVKVQEIMATRLCLQAEDDVLCELERLQVLPEREARLLREELRERLTRLRSKPIQELAPRPRELIAKVPLFQDLPEDEVERVLERLEARTYLADEVILREGSMGDTLHMIERGVVHITRGGEGLARIHLATLTAGDFFGEMAVLTGEARTATATAVTHATLYQLRRSDLQVLAGICPALQRVMRAAYEQRLVEVRARHR